VALAGAAADRLYRAYFRHCQSADEDTTFNFLNSLHSFNDKVRKAHNRSLFASVPFAGLKALRNLLHHEAELLEQVRPISVLGPVLSAELLRVCLVPSGIVTKAIGGDVAVGAAFRWYGDIVDIEPTIFNTMVDVHELVLALELETKSSESAEFAYSYDSELQNGVSHRVQGRLYCRAGDVDKILTGLHAGSAKAQ
jgi:hypothetical protein